MTLDTKTPDRPIPVAVWEGARQIEAHPINPETLKMWFHQIASRYDGRIAGITIHTEAKK